MKTLAFFTILKTVYHKLECFCGHLMSDCISSEILVYLWRRKVWRRIRGEQQTAKICTACQSLEKNETGEEKMSRRRLQMRLVSIRGSMGMQEKMLCVSMISVHGQTQEGKLKRGMRVCVWGGRCVVWGKWRQRATGGCTDTIDFWTSSPKA